MKTIAKILAGLFLLAVIYFIVADGMMVHFGLSQGIQYAYNFGAIFILIPFSLFVIVQEQMAYEKKVITTSGSSVPMVPRPQSSARERNSWMP